MQCSEKDADAACRETGRLQQGSKLPQTDQARQGQLIWSECLAGHTCRATTKQGSFFLFFAE